LCSSANFEEPQDADSEIYNALDSLL